MRRIVLAAVVVALITGAVVWAQSTVEEQTRGEPSWARLVSVVNWPAVQTVDGTVNVGNLPPVQDVSGSVEVTNLPAVQQVTGTVEVTNLPSSSGATQMQLVGFSSISVLANSGVFGFTATCQAEFPGSRMCTITEATRTVNIPDFSTASSNLAWVDSDVAGFNYTDNCMGWSTTDPTRSGWVIAQNGERFRQYCSWSISVACCAPVE